MRDRRDTFTLSLFDDHVVARSVSSGLAAGMSRMLETLLCLGRWTIHDGPRFTDFPITALGPLTDGEKDAIERLAEMGLKPWSIARQLERHPSTVTWFMSTVGLKRLGTVRKAPFTRRGKLVRPFSSEEDAFAVACSCAGDPPSIIARKMVARFGHQRSRDSVACRLQWLASDEAANEAA